MLAPLFGRETPYAFEFCFEVSTHCSSQRYSEVVRPVRQTTSSRFVSSIDRQDVPGSNVYQLTGYAERRLSGVFLVFSCEYQSKPDPAALSAHLLASPW
jgi:hypothetical protein